MGAVRRRWSMSVVLAALAVAVLSMSVAPRDSRAAIPLPLESPLVTSLLTNDMPTFKRFIMSGSNPNSTDVDKQPLLVIAVRQENIQAIEMLLDAGARVDERDAVGNSGLSWAASLGADHLVTRLLKAGADINQANQEGQTPLIRASRNGHRYAIEALLKAGADADITDYTGRKALDWVRTSRSRAAERAFMEAGLTD